jgi:very-short-patch-repair endonuclease
VRILREAYPRARFGVVPVSSIVRSIALLESEPNAIAVLDSVLRGTPLTQVDLHMLLADSPKAARALVHRTDPESESGAESLLRVALDDAGLAVTSQPGIPFTDNDRWDFLVGDRLVIEVDGDKYHSTPKQRRRDRRRDTDAHALGYLPLRVDAAQVLFDLGAVVDAVLAIVSRGHHLDTDRFTLGTRRD